MEDSEDYEIVSKRDIEHLKKEILELKRNPFGASDRGKELQDSIERLNHTINKLITIFEDADADIIEEYQESKPAEKLNQILDQNETIAKTLLKINEQLESPMPKMPESKPLSRVEPRQDHEYTPVYKPVHRPDPRNEIIYNTFESQDQPVVFNKPQIPLAAQLPDDIELPLLQPLNPRPQMPQQPQTMMSQSSSMGQFQQPIGMQPRFQMAQPAQFSVPQSNQEFDPDMTPLPPLNSNELPDRKKKFLGMI